MERTPARRKTRAKNRQEHFAIKWGPVDRNKMRQNRMQHFAITWGPVERNKMRQNRMQHFAIKWGPVDRNKMRQNRMQRLFDSIPIKAPEAQDAVPFDSALRHIFRTGGMDAVQRR